MSETVKSRFHSSWLYKHSFLSLKAKICLQLKFVVHNFVKTFIDIQSSKNADHLCFNENEFFLPLVATSSKIFRSSSKKSTLIDADVETRRHKNSSRRRFHSFLTFLSPASVSFQSMSVFGSGSLNQSNYVLVEIYSRWSQAR